MLPFGWVWRTFGDPAGWENGPVPGTHHFMGMKQNSLTLPFPDIRLESVVLIDGVWVVVAQKQGTAAACPRCQVASSARHSSYQRRFWDLPIQGRPGRITLTVCRWQCRNAECVQSIFSERLPGIVDTRARQTWRAAGILHLLVTALAAGLAQDSPSAWALQVVGRLSCGISYGTRACPTIYLLEWWVSTNGRRGRAFITVPIAVDLERRTVIDVLPDRSAVSTAAWLAERPEGRASAALICARMRPLREVTYHQT